MKRIVLLVFIVLSMSLPAFETKNIQTLGIYNPDWEIEEIIDSKMPLDRKIEAIQRVLKDPVSAQTAKKLMRFLKKEAPKKLEEIQKLIKIRSSGLA